MTRKDKRIESNAKAKNALIVILVLVALGLLARYVLFPTQVEERGDNLEKLGQWEENYKAEHPDATKADMDQSFKDGMDGLKERADNYKAEHPDATDEEVDAAFNAAWGK